MDGIDGLLALQAIFVFLVLAALCANSGRLVEAQVIGLFAAATIGFLPFNFPRPRIFMGDVGSGTLGLLIVVSVGWQIGAVPTAPLFGLIACSTFVVDSSATLLSRILSGRRWYSAHREHLYQWLVRIGYSHVKVVGLYMAWNLLIVVPALLWVSHESMNIASAGASLPIRTTATAAPLFLVYGLTVLAWIIGKRYCLASRLRVRGESS